MGGPGGKDPHIRDGIELLASCCCRSVINYTGGTFIKSPPLDLIMGQLYPVQNITSLLHFNIILSCYLPLRLPNKIYNFQPTIPANLSKMHIYYGKGFVCIRPIIKS